MREELIEEMARAIERAEAEGGLWTIRTRRATDALDAALDKLMEPSEEMVEVGMRQVGPANPCADDVTAGVWTAILSTLRSPKI